MKAALLCIQKGNDYVVSLCNKAIHSYMPAPSIIEKVECCFLVTTIEVAQKIIHNYKNDYAA